MPTDLHTARSRHRLDRRIAAADRLDAVAATLESVPDLRRELLFLALSLVAADESDRRADATAAAPTRRPPPCSATTPRSVRRERAAWGPVRAAVLGAGPRLRGRGRGADRGVGVTARDDDPGDDLRIAAAEWERGLDDPGESDAAADAYEAQWWGRS